MCVCVCIEWIVVVFAKNGSSRVASCDALRMLFWLGRVLVAVCAAALRSTWSRSMQLVFLVRALLAYKTYKQMCILLFYTNNFLYYTREARCMLVLLLLAGWHAPTIYRKYRLAFVVVVVVRWKIYLIVSIIPEPKWERDDERKRGMCINVMSECCWINVYLFLIFVWLWRLVMSTLRLESSVRENVAFATRRSFYRQ